ncbi:3-keto-5-aminohexanoate cleavage protein [Bradyrhizobium cajani]|uniref:3-keto-5-aminohexanoate cleavage protein n=1 Tax=Bradyrhizobium cajani TaxID=1928661 RepID=A0A844TDR2_9BRAD|nr:3-keto-5-aminohexanoate cleavage protein [Bradyrhizobium cajani]MCP3368613.1 3-keto-5-aminohexanoate cleavage protein [Bradyrhizobium cajani]MVT73592.1 3-keto-5-aminohexanoate cleavage protein [Bradyrhizobium cajani]
MISEVFITCAVTGGGEAPRQKNVPVTPEEIAESSIEAARAGAAAVHLHVRDLETQEGSLNPELWRAVVKRIRQSDVKPVLNLTTGEGCNIVLGGPEGPLPLGPATWMASARERLAHIEELRPEICTLDCGSKSSKVNVEGVMVNTVGMLRAMAARCKEIGVKPELEVFDTGHVVLANDLLKEGLIDGIPLYQLCLGTGNGAPPDLTTLLAMVHQLPEHAVYSAFAVGAMQLPYAVLSPLAGANVRVGLEDNLYLSRGRLATNAELVRRAKEILDWIGVRVMSSDEMREKLRL